MAAGILKINILKILRELMFGELITRLQTDTNRAETRRLVCFTIFRNGDWYYLFRSARRIVIEYFLPQSLVVAGCRRQKQMVRYLLVCYLMLETKQFPQSHNAFNVTEDGLMIRFHCSAGVPPHGMSETNSKAGSVSEESGPPSGPPGSFSEKFGSVRFARKRISELPDEMIEKILSNLEDLKDISACRFVNRRWRAIVDRSHLQALSFSRNLQYRPISRSQIVEDYHLSTRSWLTSFGNRGEELAGQLDELERYQHFPEVLFFRIAELLAGTRFFTCQRVCTLQHPVSVPKAYFSPDGRYIATAYDNNFAKIWERGLVVEQWEEKATIEHSDLVSSISFSPDGRHLATTSADRSASIWGLVAGQWQERAIILHFSWVNNANFSPDGRHLITASDDGDAKIWGLVDGQWQEQATLRHHGSVMNAHFSPDGNHIVTVATGYTAKIWGLVDGQWQIKDTIPDILHGGRDARFSPDGSHLVTVSGSDHTAKIWGFDGGQWHLEATIVHSGLINSARFSPNGRQLVTASSDRTAKIWRFVAGRQWEETATIKHTDAVYKAHFNPNGGQIVTASGDMTAKVWGPVDGRWQEKAAIRHSNRVRNACFSPDGVHFVTASDDRTAKIWLLKGDSNDIS